MRRELQERRGLEHLRKHRRGLGGGGPRPLSTDAADEEREEAGGARRARARLNRAEDVVALAAGERGRLRCALATAGGNEAGPLHRAIIIG